MNRAMRKVVTEAPSWQFPLYGLAFIHHHLAEQTTINSPQRRAGISHEYR